MPESARLAQPAFSRAHDRFGAIGYLELAENVRNVIAYRLRTQAQAISDGGVIYSLSNQTKHFTLALTQLWKCRWRRPRRRHREAGPRSRLHLPVGMLPAEPAAGREVGAVAGPVILVDFPLSPADGR